MLFHERKHVFAAHRAHGHEPAHDPFRFHRQEPRFTHHHPHHVGLIPSAEERVQAQQAFRHVHGIFRRQKLRMDPRTTQHVHVVSVFGRLRLLFRRISATCIAFHPPFHELLSQLGIRRTSGFPEPLQRRHVRRRSSLRRTRRSSTVAKRTRLAGPHLRHPRSTCDVHVRRVAEHGTLARRARRRRSGDGGCGRIRATLAVGATCEYVDESSDTCDVDAEDQRKVRGRGRGTVETSRSTLSTRRNVAGTRTCGRSHRCVETCARRLSERRRPSRKEGGGTAARGGSGTKEEARTRRSKHHARRSYRAYERRSTGPSNRPLDARNEDRRRTKSPKKHASMDTPKHTCTFDRSERAHGSLQMRSRSRSKPLPMRLRMHAHARRSSRMVTNSTHLR